MNETTHRIAFIADNAGVDAAVGAVKRLDSAVHGGSDAIGQLESQLSAIKGAGGEGLRAAGAGATTAAAGIKKIAPAAKEGGSSMEQMTYLAKGAMGPMGGLFERGTMLAKGLASLGPAALAVAAAVGVLALTTALLTATVALGKYGFEMSDAALKSRALLEGAVGGVKGANAVSDAVSRVSKGVPLAGAEVEKLATKLYNAGKRGAELEAALTKASLEAAGLGKSASPDLIRRRMLGLDIQTMKLKENVARIFSGLKIEGVLTALKDVLSIFDEGASTGNALKTMFESLFNPLFGGAAKAGPIVKNVLRGMVVGILLVVKHALMLRNAIQSVIPDGLLDSIDSVRTAMWAGVVVVTVLVAAFTVLAVVAGVVAGAMLLITAIFIGSLVVGIALVAVALLMLIAVFLIVPALVLAAAYGIYALGAYLLELAGFGGEASSGLIDGLVGGISSGAGAVMSAIENLARGMKGAIMKALGIASPSKVFAELGAFTGEGFAVGVESSEGRVASATSSLVSMPAAMSEAKMPAAMSAQGAASRGARGSITININGVRGAEQLSDSFWERVATRLDDAASMGALELEPAL